jgi:hypothetical protein
LIFPETRIGKGHGNIPWGDTVPDDETVIVFAPSNMDGHYQAIGRLATLWASLEHEINSAIWDLANIEKPCGACITAQLTSISTRLRAFAALVRHRGGTEPFVKSINKFVEKAEGLGRRRNRVIHDPWITENRQAFRLEITADKKLTYAWKLVPQHKIDNLAWEIAKARTEFLSLYERALAELPTFSRTQFEQSFHIPLDQEP